MHYYEIECGTNCVQGFENLDDAIKYANDNGCIEICEVGQSWIVYQRCSFCGKWVDTCELNENNECEYCQQATKSKA